MSIPPNARHVASQIVCMAVHDDDEDWIRDKWRAEIDAAEVLIRGLLASVPPGSAGGAGWRPIGTVPEGIEVLVRGGVQSISRRPVGVRVSIVALRADLYRPDGTLSALAPVEWHPLPEDGPGAWSQHCRPAPGEPAFVLLGRDPQAPDLVEVWAAERERIEPGTDKSRSAVAIAAEMRAYKAANPGRGLPVEAYAALSGAPGEEAQMNPAAAYAKLDGDSLDAIMEVIGEGPDFRRYNEGKSRMRQWFLGRLRRLWNLPEPETAQAVEASDGSV